MSQDVGRRPDDDRTLVVRVWLPDRPGALGQVASRIGAVHGDVTAIDILERGGGRAVDELVVEMPGSVSLDLLAKEIGAVDGVAVEHIRTVADQRADSATAILHLAAAVAEAPPSARLATFVSGLLVAVDADWAVAVQDYELVERCGEPPDLAWLLAFLDGSGHLDPARPETNTPGDVLWARLPCSGLTVATGRAERAVHERERSRIATVSRIVDHLLAPAGPPPVGVN
jgi:hypothetical protein